jgi:hypothetical protein
MLQSFWQLEYASALSFNILYPLTIDPYRMTRGEAAQEAAVFKLKAYPSLRPE